MNSFSLKPLAWAAVGVFALGDPSNAETATWVCGHGHVHTLQLAAGDPAGGRQYAPSREVDIKHLSLDVTPNFNQRSLQGVAVLRFAPIAKPLTELKLDGVDLQVREVTSTEPLQAWQATPDQIILTFVSPVAADKETTVTIRYGVTPQRGLYFRTPEMGYPADDSHLWTQGEPTEARHWFPSYDFPNEKFTSEITCRVPDGMTVLSNGRQVSSDVDPATGLRAVRWLQDKPHVNYLIALAAGHLKGIEEKHGDLPMAFYAPASQVALARNSFAGTREMMVFFEKEIGVPYPWDKYYQVAVSDYHWGGMENTTLTILNERTLYPDGFETLRSSESLVAHELAHQWFGDLVTCKDWSHLWLNEGFATYYDALYQGHKHGRDQFLYTMHQNAEGVLGVADDRTPIVHRGFSRAEEQFSFRAYPKGSWILHMLRHQLGTELFRKCVKTYLDRHRFGVVETADLARILEEFSGRSFDAFFDQYVYHAQQPDLRIDYQWSETEKLAKLTLTQNQKLSPEVLLFTMPAKIRFKGDFGTIDREITFREKVGEFYFPLPKAPRLVRFDPDLSILAKVTFPLPSAMLKVQADDSEDMIGRLQSVKQLAEKRDAESVGILKRMLQKDSFHGVRLAASRALRQINTPEAREALTTSLVQADARVRQRVFQDATATYGDDSLGLALQTLNSEKNPDIVATAIQQLGAYSRPEHKGLLIQQLTTESHRAVLAEAALSAMRGQADPSYIPHILAALRTQEKSWPSSTLIQAIQLLGHLGRLQEDKDEIRAYLMGRLGDLRERVRISAVSALGTLGDERAMGALEKLTGLSAKDRMRTAAESALDELRARRKPTVEFGDIRNEVLSLKRENQDLKRDLESLRKKVETLNAPAAPPKAAPKSEKVPLKRAGG